MHRTCAAARHGRAAVASRVLLALALGTGVACGPRGGVALPGTLNGEPSLEAESLAVTARVACSAVTSFAAEVAVTGRISGDRVRGRLLVGMASGGRVRLEALAPFGQPVFVLVATGNTATLLLPRQRQLLSDAPAHELLESLTGMRVDGADLFALLTGCVVPAARVSTGLRLPGEWWAAELDDGRATAYVRRRKEDGVPRVLAARLVPAGSGTAAISVGYDRYAADGLPRSVRLERAGGAAPVALALTLSQVDASSALDARVFEVVAPPDVAIISLEDVRRQGPLMARE